MSQDIFYLQNIVADVAATADEFSAAAVEVEFVLIDVPTDCTTPDATDEKQRC